MFPQESVSSKSKNSRRSFAQKFGLAAIIAMMAPWFTRSLSHKSSGILSCIPNGTKKTVKLLTEDGMLVVIDEDRLPSSMRRISNEELQQWIKHK